jgi:molecular chaperone DnaK
MARATIGIDLGTTNSAVAAVISGAPRVLLDARRRSTMPSVVSFPEAGGTLIGHEARARLVDAPQDTIYSAKRLIGRAFTDPAVRAARHSLPYEIVPDTNGQVAVQTRAGHTYSVTEISAMILHAVASRARAEFGTGQLSAVITVPANFNDSQREYTRVAGRIAGLEVLRIVNEPTAAALAFGFDGAKDGLVAVYDFGGGTFDISLVEIKGGVYRVLSTAGDAFLGGDDLDVALAGQLADKFRKTVRIDLRRSQAEWQRLLFATERAKCELADKEETEVVIREAGFAEKGAVDLRMKVTRTDLASVAYAFVERSIELMHRCIQAARVSSNEITDVILVGGTTRVPLVGAAVSEFFGRAARRDIDPMHAVALGAALHAALLTGAPIKTTQPATPAYQSAEEAPTAPNVLLVDVLPHSIGIAVAGGGVEWILKANAVVPTEERRRFTTWRDDQQEMRFVLLQGDSPHAAENTRLGEFVVPGLRAAKAGAIEIEVFFEVDVNGILCVTAMDLDSKRETSRRLKISGPSAADIERAEQRLGGLKSMAMGPNNPSERPRPSDNPKDAPNRAVRDPRRETS